MSGSFQPFGLLSRLNYNVLDLSVFEIESQDSVGQHYILLEAGTLQFIPAWASWTAELAQLNYDARSILTTWGNPKASEFGLHEYANRDWTRLMSDCCLPRLKMYSDALTVSLDTKSPIGIPLATNGIEDRQSTRRALSGQSYAAALAIARDLNLAPLNEITRSKTRTDNATR